MARRRKLALLLTPGAGAGADQAALVAVDEAVRTEGVPVLRMDFPYRLAGRKSPDRPPKLIGAIRDGAARLAEEAGVRPGDIVLGGRSMGGRMCSMAAAEGLPAAGLVLISYPLHPPGRPEKARTEHLPAIEVPCLFVSGTRDAFGTREELETASQAIRGAVTHVWIDGGDHGLRRKDAAVAAAVRDWITNLRQ